MKGTVELTATTLIVIIAMVAVLGIIIWFAYFYIYSYYLPRYTTESRIAQLCPEWVEKQCTEVAATNDLSITVDTTYIPLSQLCTEFFDPDGDGDPPWSEVYEKCKKKCIGCP